jgi:hypothetical protein
MRLARAHKRTGLDIREQKGTTKPLTTVSHRPIPGEGLSRKEPGGKELSHKT